TLEALRLFLLVDGTAFIIAADETLIEYAVRQHFPGLPYTEGPAAFTRSYLEKLIQVPFRLPPMSIGEAHGYISLLFVEAALRGNAGEFAAMLAGLVAARADAWLPLHVDISSIEQHVPSNIVVSARLRDQLLIAKRISKTLAAGSRGNPRQIKRFLNTLMLRMRLADAYAMSMSVNESVLAKLMLLERFNPVLYRVLEDVVKGSETGKVPGIDSAGGDSSAETTLPETLSTSSAFGEWAQLEPRLDNLDLRPYLFVSREYAPGYIGESSYPDIPAALVSRLMNATQFDDSALENELSALSGIRSERLLDILFTELRSRGGLSQLDGPLRGIGALVRSQKHLQGALLSAIDTYPSEKVGSFVPLFLRRNITDTGALERLKTIEDRWTVDGEPALKEAVLVGRRPQVHQ
ncbi:MAG: P-loop NTPase fold protein, partial [Acidobacteriaceae bacterium]